MVARCSTAGILISTIINPTIPILHYGYAALMECSIGDFVLSVFSWADVPQCLRYIGIQWAPFIFSTECLRAKRSF